MTPESEAPYGDGVPVVIDTSAWVRAAEPAVASRWAATIRARAMAVSTAALLEILQDARTKAEFDRLAEGLARLRQLPVTQSVSDAAVSAMRELAGQLDGKPGFHRVPPSDYLTAAAAAEHGFGVLHYDRHFDRLSGVLPFKSVWIAPPGTLD